MKIIDNLKENIYSFMGNRENVINTIINPQAGAKKYWKILAKLGNTNSLEKSLMASLKGCASPTILTLLGPFRNCLYPRIFRSRSVTNATFTKIAIIKIK
jgi:hypothetical protein|tara:strand:+ start:1626 stop:1925 length:300 start_codon:yes stop_codon:yes gene_type:complete